MADNVEEEEDPTGDPFECNVLDGGEWPLPLLESLTGGVKFCGFRLRDKTTRQINYSYQTKTTVPKLQVCTQK